MGEARNRNYYNDTDLLECPKAPVPDSNQWGNSQEGWYRDATNTGASYGINYGIHNNPAKSWTYQSEKAVEDPTMTPVIGDMIWVDNYIPQSSQTIYGNLEGASDNGSSRMVVNRHNPLFVNWSFVDGHAESVKLVKLWTYYWHKTFVTAEVVPY